jgi:GNAT superfamily N-acetyltransferase
MEKIITIDNTNIEKEHICCAISDKKCQESYELKKDWLRQEFENGYVFKRIDARAKVFIEYGPAEKAWAPVHAPEYLLINCLWVSGQYKGQGYGKLLLQHAIDEAVSQGKSGLATIVGTTKFHFMSDTKWLLKQGFQSCQKLPYGFSLLVKKLKPDAEIPRFNSCVLTGECPDKEGIAVYYSNRCPFTEFHLRTSLTETASKRKLPLKIYKLETIAQAQESPSPATIFSLFVNGKFVTTDVSVCMDSRFDKILG